MIDEWTCSIGTFRFNWVILSAKQTSVLPKGNLLIICVQRGCFIFTLKWLPSLPKINRRAIESTFHHDKLKFLWSVVRYEHIQPHNCFVFSTEYFSSDLNFVYSIKWYRPIKTKNLNCLQINFFSATLYPAEHVPRVVFVYFAYYIICTMYMYKYNVLVFRKMKGKQTSCATHILYSTLSLSCLSSDNIQCMGSLYNLSRNCFIKCSGPKRAIKSWVPVNYFTQLFRNGAQWSA